MSVPIPEPGSIWEIGSAPMQTLSIASVCRVSFDPPGTLGEFHPHLFAAPPCVGDRVILSWVKAGLPRGFARVIDRAIDEHFVYLWVKLIEEP